MHKGNIRCFVIMISIISILFSSSASSHNRRFISIGTASISGIYYPIGAALCRIVNKQHKDIQCSVQATPGSIYNLNVLQRSDIDIGIVQADSEYNAYNGVGVFKHNKPMSNLRTLFLLHHDVFTVVARKGLNISTLDDIKNKRVNIGSPGTGVRDTMQEIMSIKQWSKKDFKLASELKSSEQAQALCDNKIDVMIDVIGHPNSSIQEASATCDTVIIPIDRATIEELQKRHSYYDAYTIPGGIYAGAESDIDTFAVRTGVVSTDRVDDVVVYKLVKSVFENFRYFNSVHPLLAKLTQEDVVDTNSVPLHNGAIKYYKEIGLL